MPKEKVAEPEPDARERSDNIKKLLAAGAILTGGIVANRCEQGRGTPAPPAQVKPQLIPTVPVPVVEEEPGVWAMNVHGDDAGRVR